MEQAVFLIPEGHPDKPGRLNNLGNSYQSLFNQFGRLDDLRISVSCLEQAVFLTPDGFADKPGQLSNLGNSYQSLFQYSGQLEDAGKAISCLMQASSFAPADHPDQTTYLSKLGSLFWDMFKSSQLPAHALRATNYWKSAALVVAGSPFMRHVSSCAWALSSHLCGLPPIEAYTSCMTLIPHVIWLGASAQDRYERLAPTVGVLATEAATAAISHTRYDLALEWLEQGRSVVWGQTLQLRSPHDELYAVHPELAEELRLVSAHFEHTSTALSSGASTAGGGEPPHKTAQRHRWLAQRREELIECARRLPGLEDFLRPPKASQIMSWVQDKTTVIVNVHEFRCDALVIQAGARDITHIPLPDFSVQKAKEARAELGRCLLARGFQRGIKPDRRKLDFKDILEMLWTDVAKPVLDHLGITHPLPVDEMPHITWCTTGLLSFLPLHAAGDYSNPATVLPNLAISSYTPTVSARKPRTSSPAKFSGILAVGHMSAIPDRKLQALPGTRDELDRVQAHAKGLLFTRLDEANARTDSVLQAMKERSWVHLACHASQNKTDPTKSAFHLHDADLDLDTISRNPLENAQFAFLSACQTATGDSDLPDESIHLAAGMLNAGFPTVIATMWSINDKDAPIVADKVYECLLEGGVPDSGKAAKALHKAVTHLRQQIGEDEFERWVPYIHLGC
ncbi:hypothetical protein FS749_001959 [Ceratobasidium sp. UAMH 11750]|nr:hypothetical protein FS749_001959 [Ceratobasidium sp. UAMH 11750]